MIMMDMDVHRFMALDVHRFMAFVSLLNKLSVTVNQVS